MSAGVTFPGQDELHVWSFALDLGEVETQRCAALLSADEMRCAAAFHFDRDRQRFVVARARLRTLLADYLALEPRAIVFSLGPQGKPQLAGAHRERIQFNVSHSHGHALIAFGHGTELGIDLEKIRTDVDCGGIVSAHFSPAERAAWLAMPAGEQRDAFFRGWVRKEAYVKARGEGLARDPVTYTVNLSSSVEGPVSLDDAGDPAAASHFRVRPIAAPSGYAAAIAWTGADRRVIVREM